MQIDELNKRIIEVMVAKGHSKSTFAKALDVSLPLITHITSGRNKPGIELIQKVLAVFEDINPDWLLLGRGELYRQEAKTIDMSDIQVKITQLKAQIDEPIEALNAILSYHKLLIDEVLYLQEVSLKSSDSIFQLNNLKQKLDSINLDIESKLSI